MPETKRAARRRRLILLLMASVILLPSLWGFGTKFVEFITLYRGDVEGAFAITPILNYLLASLGFICLFIWAIFTGMFRDIEGPKWTMLENEALLDRQSDEPPGADFAGRPSGPAPRTTPHADDHHRFRDYYDRD
jgi:nitrogen fixation-related uncharacterized protein